MKARLYVADAAAFAAVVAGASSIALATLSSVCIAIVAVEELTRSRPRPMRDW